MADATRSIVCQAKVQADRFRMADMEIAIRFRWKARNDSTAMFAGFVIGGHNATDKV